MKARLIIASCLLAALAFTVSIRAPAQEEKPKSEKFGALAYMPHGAGPAMVGSGARANVDLYIRSYTSDNDKKILAQALREGGSEALLKRLEDAKSIEKITLPGRVVFYDQKLIPPHRPE